MPRTLRPTGLSFPAYADKLDYVVCDEKIPKDMLELASHIVNEDGAL